MTPWQYAKPGCSEHASQAALFQWCKMAEKFGVSLQRIEQIEKQTIKMLQIKLNGV